MGNWELDNAMASMNCLSFMSTDKTVEVLTLTVLGKHTTLSKRLEILSSN